MSDLAMADDFGGDLITVRHVGPQICRDEMLPEGILVIFQRLDPSDGHVFAQASMRLSGPRLTQFCGLIDRAAMPGQPAPAAGDGDHA